MRQKGLGPSGKACLWMRYLSQGLNSKIETACENVSGMSAPAVEASVQRSWGRSKGGPCAEQTGHSVAGGHQERSLEGMQGQALRPDKEGSQPGGWGEDRRNPRRGRYVRLQERGGILSWGPCSEASERWDQRRADFQDTETDPNQKPGWSRSRKWRQRL